MISRVLLRKLFRDLKAMKMQVFTIALVVGLGVAKRKVAENMLPDLKGGGYFIVGHSESLTGITDRLQVVKPTIYRNPS